MKDWSDRVRELEEIGLTLTEIGSKVGLSTSSVSDIKRGATKQPRANSALKLDALHRRLCKPDHAA